jgi:hypothetical protein
MQARNNFRDTKFVSGFHIPYFYGFRGQGEAYKALVKQLF